MFLAVLPVKKQTALLAGPFMQRGEIPVFSFKLASS
jgi:hypothetical protein